MAMIAPFHDPVAARIADFLTGIGLTVRAGVVPDRTILPGLYLENGGLVVDEVRLLYPGDLLHEAGHLAVTPAAARPSLTGDTGGDGGEEIAAIGWSYAAALHLNLDPAVVFHSAGYREGSAALLENFRERRYLGLPYLQWIGLTDARYPAMIRWLRD